jgi:hypothetical protein
LYPSDERAMLTMIAAMAASVTLCERIEKLVAFLELQSAIRSWSRWQAIITAVAHKPFELLRLAAVRYISIHAYQTPRPRISYWSCRNLHHQGSITRPGRVTLARKKTSHAQKV